MLLSSGKELTMSHGDPTGINGNVRTANGNAVKASGGQRITGDIYVSGSSLSIGSPVLGDVIYNSNKVQTALETVRNTANDYANQCTGKPRIGIRIDSPTTTDYCKGSTGKVFVCVNNLEIKSLWTLSGSCTVVLNVFGTFKMDGSDNTGAKLIVNSRGTGDVASSGGGGGCGCCKSKLNGALFAKGNVRLSPGYVTFVAAEGNIVMSSGSEINCPPPGKPDDVCLA